ncbi:hypothetical protein HG535_0F00870 [Zygotorulaspora mrakii]|uniref:Uncharacterized protein n=1 Tax=Zygotorulaspora mrakii TaxID=42260 RepID=A0A7H9B4W0_ZYGMR|nr:uncharacterized protein HG535_0F00870 [Zygotorulaspora mrakii]QLG73577.1 hypothetical protein HG535_0F00870 [Zygotorulaspora mrakii]
MTADKSQLPAGSGSSEHEKEGSILSVTEEAETSNKTTAFELADTIEQTLKELKQKLDENYQKFDKSVVILEQKLKEPGQ